MKKRGQKIIPPKERIKKLSQIDDKTGCWNWISSCKGKEKLTCYGSLIVGSRSDGTRKTISAHRYSYLTFIGEIIDGLWVLHKCDNPKCVNPDHLFLGTRQDNVNDRENKGRNKVLKGVAAKNSFLSQSQVDEIREKYKSGKYTFRELAKEYGFRGHSSIQLIIKGLSYKNPDNQ